MSNNLLTCMVSSLQDHLPPPTLNRCVYTQAKAHVRSTTKPWYETLTTATVYIVAWSECGQQC